MMLRARLGSIWFTISIRICSLSSSVQGEQSRNTTLNSTHCNSSHELEEVSSTLRTIALTADTTTATKISHATRLPVHLVNASMPRLIFRSVCKMVFPQFPLLLSWLGIRHSGLSSPARLKPGHHFSAGRRRQLENGRNTVQPVAPAGESAGEARDELRRPSRR